MKNSGPNSDAYGDFFNGITGIEDVEWDDPPCTATYINPLWYDDERPSCDEGGGGYELLVLTTPHVVVGLLDYPRRCTFRVRGFSLGEDGRTIVADGNYVHRMGRAKKSDNKSTLREKLDAAIEYMKAVVRDTTPA